MLAQLNRDSVRAERLFRESLELSRAHGDKDGTCVGLYNLGVVLMTMLEPDVGGVDYLEEAERCFIESIALARGLGDKSRLALCFTKLGEIALERGGESAFTEATTLIEDGLALHRELGDKAAIAFTLTDLGYAALLSADLASARSVFEEGLNVSRTLKSKGHIGLNLYGLAVTLGAAALASNSREIAARDARRAVQLYAASEAYHNPVLPQVVSSYYRMTMDAARGMLPQSENEDLQALGRKMSLDEAIEFALASVDP
jgi:hypothetical protein